MNRPAKAGQPVTRYELPESGITLLGYVVRRMHKTKLLESVPALLQTGQSGEALVQIALYAAAASASFGPAFYQPAFNTVGARVSEADPATEALVTAWREEDNPHLVVGYDVEMPGGVRFTGREEITGTTIGLGSLGMPAPARFQYTGPDGYSAELAGVITSELTLRLFGRPGIRAQGRLSGRDSGGQAVRVLLGRDSMAVVGVEAPDGRTWKRVERLADWPGTVRAG